MRATKEEPSYLKKSFKGPLIGAYNFIAKNSNGKTFLSTEHERGYIDQALDTYRTDGKASVAKILNPFRSIKFLTNLSQVAVAKFIDPVYIPEAEGSTHKNRDPHPLEIGAKAVAIAPLYVVNAILSPIVFADELPGRAIKYLTTAAAEASSPSNNLSVWDSDIDNPSEEKKSADETQTAAMPSTSSSLSQSASSSTATSTMSATSTSVTTTPTATPVAKRDSTSSVFGSLAKASGTSATAILTAKKESDLAAQQATVKAVKTTDKKDSPQVAATPSAAPRASEPTYETPRMK